jgi:putative aldouronate transport system substrate-binding protein
MKEVKKVLSIILVITMICFSFAGCKSSKDDDSSETSTEPTTAPAKDDTTKPTAAATQAPDTETVDLSDIIPKDTVTLTVYSQLANYSGEQVGWFAQVMKERFNVKLNIIPTGDGVFATRMESGDLGDIILFGNDGDEYKQAIDADMLYDWNEDNLLQDYGPYIAENMKLPLEKNAGLSPDGTVYGYGYDVGSSSKEHGAFFYHPDLRWDLYSQLGYPKISTLEDYVDVIEDMVALAPKSDSGAQTYGMSLFHDWDGDMVMYVKALGALYGYDEFGFTLYDVNTQTAQPILDDNSMYIRSLKFYNALYQKGLLDPDSMTQTYDDAVDAYQDGAAVFNIFTFLGADLYNTDAHTGDGKGMFALAADDMKPLCYGLNIFGGNRIWSIGANTEYPELCMAIINWTSTPEGVMTYLYGPQGLTWDYDANGNAYLTDLGVACKRDQTTELTGGTYTGKFEDGTAKWNNSTWAPDSINQDGNGETFNYLFWKSWLDKPATKAMQAWKDYTGFACADDYLEDTGHISISLGTDYSMGVRDDELNTTWQQVKDCVKTYSWNLVYAKNDDEFNSILAEFISKAKEYGYDECVEWCMNEATLRKAAEDKVKAQN